MSYDIACVKNEYATKCMQENIDLGRVMEEDPDSIPDLSQESREAIKNCLLNVLDEYQIETQNDTLIVFKHKEKDSVQVSLGEKVVFFKAGASEQWTILEATAVLIYESGTDVARFDFQDGRWD